MNIKDQLSESYCYYRLRNSEGFCRTVEKYNLPLIILIERGIPENFVKQCSNEINLTRDFNYIDLKIYHLYQIDQYIRNSSIIDSTLYDYFENYYIFNSLKEILEKVRSFSDISQYSISYLEVLLLHQVRGREFYQINEKNIKKMLNLNLIEAHQYATIIDNYHQYNFGKQVYGTWNLFRNNICIIEVYEPENLDNVRKSIGLPSFDFEPMFLIHGVNIPDWYQLK